MNNLQINEIKKRARHSSEVFPEKQFIVMVKDNQGQITNDCYIAVCLAKQGFEVLTVFENGHEVQYVFKGGQI